MHARSRPAAAPRDHSHALPNHVAPAEPRALGGTSLQPSLPFIWRTPRSLSPPPAFALRSALFRLYPSIRLAPAPADASQSSGVGTRLRNDPRGRDGVPERDGGNNDSPHSASSCGGKSRREARTEGVDVNAPLLLAQRSPQGEGAPPGRAAHGTSEAETGLRRDGSSAGSCDSTWGN